MDRLAKAFDQAEEVILMPVYPASEQPIEGADTKALYAAMQAAGHNHVKYLVRSDQVLRYLKQVARAGDIILFLGAGDVGRLACRLVEQLDEHSY
jgi:UDP-N-acetylmuramate--alanine ligase